VTHPLGLDYSDAAKRCSDTIRTHIVAGKAGRWAAIRLSDGGSDGIAYDTRADAIDHQLHETQCAYVQIPLDDMPPAHAQRYLAFHRAAYDGGFRLTDPDDRREVIMPYTIEGLSRLIGAHR
jgi:hypothetical protein